MLCLWFAAYLAACSSESDSPCGRLSKASNVAELRELLSEQYIFFDVDETLVMPDTPFIYGLPGSDAFLKKLQTAECPSYNNLTKRMEEAYYNARETLVDPDMPALIAGLRSQDKQVFALTSRSLNSSVSWHNDVVLRALDRYGVSFSELSPRTTSPAVRRSTIGGVIFAGSEEADKAVHMAALVPEGAVVALVDNSLEKVERALENGDACLHGIHFTPAYDRERSDADRHAWLCGLKSEDAAIDCDIGPCASV